MDLLMIFLLILMSFIMFVLCNLDIKISTQGENSPVGLINDLTSRKESSINENI